MGYPQKLDMAEMAPLTHDQGVTQVVTEKAYAAFFEQSVWAFCRDVERVIRPFSTSDFEREYFIPDL